MSQRNVKVHVSIYRSSSYGIFGIFTRVHNFFARIKYGTLVSRTGEILSIAGRFGSINVETSAIYDHLRPHREFIRAFPDSQMLMRAIFMRAQ